MRKFIAIVLTTLMCLGICCSCVETDSSQLSIWWGPGDKYQKPLVEALERFKKNEPTFRYDIQSQSSPDYHVRVAQLMANAKTEKKAPDIIRTAHYMQSLGYNGKLVNLAEYGCDSIKNQFIPSSWRANMLGDAVYGLPLDGNTTVLMYNKQIFKSAGVTNPPTNMQEFVDAASKIKKIGKLPYDLPALSDASGFTTFSYIGNVAKMGGKLISDDYKKALLNSPESIATMKEMLKMQGGFEKLYPDSLEKDYGKFIDGTVWKEADFYNGLVGMIDMGSWNLNRINEEQFGVARPFVWKEGIEAKTTLGLYSLAMTSKCANKEMGYKLMQFLASDNIFQKAFAESMGTMPTLSSALLDEKYNKGYWAVYKAQLENTVERPTTPAWDVITKYIQDAVSRILTLGENPDIVLAEANAKAQKELDKYIAA